MAWLELSNRWAVKAVYEFELDRICYQEMVQHYV
jgi:hypothetical protein